MGADVTSLLTPADANDSPAPPPITRDLLGGSTSSSLQPKDLNLDLQVPCAWENRLDLKSGKVYLQRCSSSKSSSSSSETKSQDTKSVDLNLPPTSKQPLTLFDDSSLDLKLVSLSSASPSTSNYQSLCTLEKVKLALERAEKGTGRKRLVPMSMSSPVSTSSSDLDQEEKSSGAFASGCPCCLLYVLITRSDPKCPRCNNIIQLPGTDKKPRIDLNISI